MGSEKKTTLLFEGTRYMIKYPDTVREKNNELSYVNNQFSEHLGCEIFRSCGFDVQETILGTFPINGAPKVVVACKDFTQDGAILHEFTKLGNAVANTGEKFKTSIENIDTIIDQCSQIVDKDKIKAKFWDMFIVDTLIGNSDRHLDNWGLLEIDKSVRFAPIYDCGSSLAPLRSDEKMKELLANPAAFKNEEYNVISCYSMSNKRIFYHEIYKNPPKALSEAVKRIVPKIDMGKICNIITTTEGMSPVRKEYILKAIAIRYEQILTPALKRELTVVQQEYTNSMFENHDTEQSKNSSTMDEWKKMIQQRRSQENASEYGESPRSTDRGVNKGERE